MPPAAWRDEFSREYARVSGEAAEIQGPLGEMREYYRMDFSRCGGPCARRVKIEKITAWLRDRPSKTPEGVGVRMQTMIRTGLEKLMTHVCANESVCCTRHELMARSQTKRMIDELRELVEQSGGDENECDLERTRT